MPNAKGSTRSFLMRVSNGASRAARCASARMATWSGRANDAYRRPIAISSARQGPGALTHLASPRVAAASAIAGMISIPARRGRRMKAFTVCEGIAAPLMRDNIDTDMIVRVERIAQLQRGQFAPWAFEMLRYQADGSEDASSSSTSRHSAMRKSCCPARISAAAARVRWRSGRWMNSAFAA